MSTLILWQLFKIWVTVKQAKIYKIRDYPIIWVLTPSLRAIPVVMGFIFKDYRNS